MSTHELWGQHSDKPSHHRIDWMYPNIYADRAERSRITISMIHTRAADNLHIEFDSKRNGYVLRMDLTRECPTDLSAYVVEEAQEVGFVPAWNEMQSPPESVGEPRSEGESK